MHGSPIGGTGVCVRTVLRYLESLVGKNRVLIQLLRTFRTLLARLARLRVLLYL